MKKLLVATLLLSSCGLFKTKAPIDEETTEAPPIIYSDEKPGKVIYSRDFVTGDDVLEDPDAEVCEHEEFTIVDSMTIKKQLVQNVWKTQADSYVATYDDTRLIRSKYLHVKDAELKVVRGDNLHFIAWIVGELDGIPLVWSSNVYRPNNPKTSKLNFDGSINVVDKFVYEGNSVSAHLSGEARGKSPREETKLELNLHMSSFYNCE